MRKIFVAMVLAALVFSSASYAAEPTDATGVINQHAKAIAAVVANTWEVRVEGDTIVIARKQMAEMLSNMPSQPTSNPNDPKRFLRPELILVVAPVTTDSDLATLHKRNADRAMALEMLERQMTDLRRTKPSIYDGGYAASTPAQQARLDAYIAANKALPYHVPPTLYAADAAFYWRSPWDSPVEAAIQEEMDQVVAKIDTLFAKKPLK